MKVLSRRQIPTLNIKSIQKERLCGSKSNFGLFSQGPGLEHRRWEDMPRRERLLGMPQPWCGVSRTGFPMLPDANVVLKVIKTLIMQEAYDVQATESFTFSLGDLVINSPMKLGI